VIISEIHQTVDDSHAKVEGDGAIPSLVIAGIKPSPLLCWWEKSGK